MNDLRRDEATAALNTISAAVALLWVGGWGLSNLRRFASAVRSTFDRYGMSEWTWSLVTDESWQRRFYAVCDPRNKHVFFSCEHVVRDEWIEVEDTIRHEVAHAISGVAGHGPKWQAAARFVGCRHRKWPRLRM